MGAPGALCLAQVHLHKGFSVLEHAPAPIGGLRWGLLGGRRLGIRDHHLGAMHPTHISRQLSLSFHCGVGLAPLALLNAWVDRHCEWSGVYRVTAQDPQYLLLEFFLFTLLHTALYSATCPRVVLRRGKCTSVFEPLDIEVLVSDSALNG